MRSVITRRDKVHAYRAKIQSRFSRKQSLKRKIFILYFRLLFSRTITPLSACTTSYQPPCIYIHRCVELITIRITESSGPFPIRLKVISEEMEIGLKNSIRYIRLKRRKFVLQVFSSLIYISRICIYRFWFLCFR